MKIAVFGKTPESKHELAAAAEKEGFEYEEKLPDIVISYGGDGTFLRAERKYPGVIKALFRYSNICKKCHNLPINHALAIELNRCRFQARIVGANVVEIFAVAGDPGIDGHDPVEGLFLLAHPAKTNVDCQKFLLSVF